MNPNGLDTAPILEALDDLRRQMRELSDRVAELEQVVTTHSETLLDSPEALSEETVLAISAAIAAYLGKKPRIRQIRLIGGGRWAQHGRATIQASRALNVRHS